MAIFELAFQTMASTSLTMVHLSTRLRLIRKPGLNLIPHAQLTQSVQEKVPSLKLHLAQ